MINLAIKNVPVLITNHFDGLGVDHLVQCVHLYVSGL